MPLNELFEKWLKGEVQEIEISTSSKMEFARLAFSAGRRIGKLETAQQGARAGWWLCECGIKNHPSWDKCQDCSFPRTKCDVLRRRFNGK